MTSMKLDIWIVLFMDVDAREWKGRVECQHNLETIEMM
jgi:hypothetical protein